MENQNKELSLEDLFLLELDLKLPCDISQLQKELTLNQITLVGDLCGRSLIYLRWNDDIPHENYQELALTNYGELEVFKLKNIEELTNFKEYLMLKNYDYSNSLLDKFLLTSDLTKSAQDILTVQNFECFSCIYDLNIRK